MGVSYLYRAFSPSSSSSVEGSGADAGGIAECANTKRA